MTDADKELRRRMKEEADEFLFDGLQFDAGLQEKVRRATSHDQKPLRSPERLRPLGKLWGYGSAAVAAAVLGLVLVSSPWLRQGTADVNPPAALFATGEMKSTPAVESRLLPSPEEAKTLFGNGLLVPAFAPDGVKPSGIYASGIRDNEAGKVVFHYQFGETAYSVIEEKNVSPVDYHGFDRIGIRGTRGYLKTGEADTELVWFANGVRYTVIGTISGTEAVKIAQSMK